MKVFRYGVPIDDEAHTLRLSGQVVAVDQRCDDHLDVWALSGVSEERTIKVQVYGTGHDVPDYATYIGTSLSPERGPHHDLNKGYVSGTDPRGTLVWHLFDVTPVLVKCDNHRPIQHRDGKPPWCRLCGLTANFQEPKSMIGQR